MLPSAQMADVFQRRERVAVNAREQKMGLRETKKAGTHAKLVDAALCLIGERGYDATSIEDIVNFAGVSKRTFFRYFSSKDDILVEWIGGFGEHVCASLKSRPTSEGPIVALQSALIHSVKLYESEYFLSMPLERAIHDSPAIMGRKLLKFKVCAESVGRELAKRMTMGAELYFAPSVIAHCMIAVLLGISDTWGVHGSKGQLSTLLAKAFARMKIEFKAI